MNNKTLGIAIMVGSVVLVIGVLFFVLGGGIGKKDLAQKISFDQPVLVSTGGKEPIVFTTTVLSEGTKLKNPNSLGIDYFGKILMIDVKLESKSNTEIDSGSFDINKVFTLSNKNYDIVYSQVQANDVMFRGTEDLDIPQGGSTRLTLLYQIGDEANSDFVFTVNSVDNKRKVQYNLNINTLDMQIY